MSQERATCWSCTINNPNEGDEDCINLARQKGWKVEGQLERGENGTPHYQLMVRTPQVRFTAVKKAFPRAHIEVARNQSALSAYVHKEETREGELRAQPEQYPSLDRFWSLVLEELIPEDTQPYLLLDNDVYPASRFTMNAFDRAVSHLIRRGYRVETMAVNPQMRSAWRLYARDLMYRHAVDRDRQTVNEEVASINIPTHAIQAPPVSPPPPPGCP